MSMRGSLSASISLTARAREACVRRLPPLLAVEAAEVATRSSTIVFHAPQAGQRPAHFDDSAPHSEQNHAVFTVFFAIK